MRLLLFCSGDDGGGGGGSLYFGQTNLELVYFFLTRAERSKTCSQSGRQPPYEMLFNDLCGLKQLSPQNVCQVVEQYIGKVFH